MGKGQFSYKKLLQLLEKGIGKPASRRIRNTLELAYEGHRGQYRDVRDSKMCIPFIVHPVGTAINVIKYFSIVENIEDDLETLICTALSHDLLEDTRIEGSQLMSTSGDQVYRYVMALTKPPAAIAGKTKDERNRDFINRISKAGNPAIYIKICDSIHNLSRPASTPPHLFSKAISKAYQQYLPLLEQHNLGSQFKDIYIDMIREAEKRAEEEKRYALNETTPSSIKEAVSQCVNASRGKILELHDITEILSRICRAKSATIWKSIPGDDKTLKKVSGSDIGISEIHTGNIILNDLPHKIEGKDLINFPSGYSLITIPMQIGPHDRYLVVISFEHNGIPEWLDSDSATLFVQFLAKRLIVANTDRRINLASTAASLGLQLDVDLASQLDVEPDDLTMLRKWRDRCNQAISIVRHILDLYFQKRRHYSKFYELVQVESRLKTVNSTIDKMTNSNSYNWPDFELLEDMAGVRVICPTRDILKTLVHYLSHDISSTAEVRLSTHIPDNHRDYIAHPTKSGYKAIHLILDVKTYLDDEGGKFVPCEIQFRTLFQDVWAKISHATLYHASRKERRRLSNKLFQISEMLNQCEELSEELTKYTNSRESK